MTKVAIVTGDVLGSRMSGPAIRSVELGRILDQNHEVRVCPTVPVSVGTIFGVDVMPCRTMAEARATVEWADVVVVQGLVTRQHPRLLKADVLVVDLYDPFHLEHLNLGASTPRRHSLDASLVIGALTSQIERGDFFMCASERQRHYWLGHLGSAGRLNIYNHDADPTFRSLIDVVPFGLSSTPPATTRRVVRGVVPGIGMSDPLVVWGGGLYPWFDPVTLVHAVEKLLPKMDDIRLVFPGGVHPNSSVPAMSTAGETRAAADAAGLLNRNVFFLEEWLPYEDRASFLLEADVGVSTHRDHLETEFSFRTRVLDYLWCSLPIVTTEGDSMADLVGREGLGAVVRAEDVDSVAGGLLSVLEDRTDRAGMRIRVRNVAVRFQWNVVAAPLLKFVDAPNMASDRGYEARRRPATSRSRRFRRNVLVAQSTLVEEGPRIFASKLGRKVRGLAK